jgi:penicillin-binding protein 2
VHGTAAGINDDKVKMSGKTGTAQNPHGKEHAWFAGWAPYENPQIAVCALVENAGHGSTYAAPICFEIAKQYLFPPPPDTVKPAPVDTLPIVPEAPTAIVIP